jgi:glycosyltransferase involved in cell wall biosynthesis
MSASCDAYLDSHIVVSRSLKQNLMREHGLASDRIEVIQNGIDVGWIRRHGTATARYRQELKLSPDTFVVSYIGRFSPEKRPDLVLESFARLRSQLPGEPMKLIMAGDGELRSALLARVEALDLHRDVHFLGFIDDVPGLLADTDVLLLTSRTEGMPIVVLEAMALAKPVVATAVGGVPELIEEGRSGLLVPDDHRTVVAVQDHLRRLLQDRSFRLEIGREAASRVEMEFSLDGMVRRYAALL